MWGLLLLFAMAIPMGVPTALYGEFYRYTDEQGRAHFLDDYSRIPYQYRQDTRSYPEKYDRLPDEDRRRCEVEDRYAALFLRDVRDQQTGGMARARGPLETPIVFRENQILVPVVLAHRDKHIQAYLLLDTGAAMTVVFRDTARALDLGASGPREVRLVDGRRVAVMDVTIHSIRVGPFRIANAAAVVLPGVDQKASYQGLLGMDILQRLSHTIDIKRRVIRWNPDASSRNMYANCTPPMREP